MTPPPEEEAAPNRAHRPDTPFLKKETGALLASLGLHIGLVVIIVNAAPEVRSSIAHGTPVEFELAAIVEPRREETVTEAPTPTPSPEPRPPDRTRLAPRLPEAPSPDSDSSLGPVPDVAHGNPAAPAPTDGRVPLVSLDPSAVAHAWHTTTTPNAASDPNASHDRDRPRTDGMALLANDLATAARTPHTSERPPPKLRRRADGSVTYRGPIFSALIQPNGEVVFTDRGPITPDGFGTRGIDDGMGGTSGVGSSSGYTMRFDINDALERAAGNDPHWPERRWFLKHTEALRIEMERQHAARESVTGLIALRKRMQAIWNDRTNRAAQRRAALFALWDGCSEDRQGQSARDAIVEFIRRHLGASSENRFKEHELAEFNRRRASRAPFSPY